MRRKPSQQLPTLEDERSLLPFEDQFFDVESQPSELGTVYCVKVVGVLFRSHQCPIAKDLLRLFVEELIFKWQEQTFILESRKLLAWLSAHPEGSACHNACAHDLLGMRNLQLPGHKSP